MLACGLSCIWLSLLRGQEAEQDILAAHHLEGPGLLAAASLARHGCEAHQKSL